MDNQHYQHSYRYPRANTIVPLLADNVLVGSALSGDVQAFETLVKRYSDSLLAFIISNLRLIGQTDQAPDVLQHVLLQLHLALPLLTAHTSLKPWLFRVARNRCIDEMRKQSRRPTVHLSDIERTLLQDESSLSDLIPDTAPQPEDIAEQHDLEYRVQLAIATLPTKLRRIVFLRYTQQLNFTEIAQRLNMPRATVKTYFHRARPLLHTALIAQQALPPFPFPSAHKPIEP